MYSLIFWADNAYITIITSAYLKSLIFWADYAEMFTCYHGEKVVS